MTEHPMQPIELDKNGIAHFKQNTIVRYLLDAATARNTDNMNTLALIPFSDEDRTQFAQLIGYSVNGAGDLSYFDEDVIAKADEEAARLVAAAGENSKSLAI